MEETPVGVPAPAISEMLQKGTIDAAGVDYGGAYMAYKPGGLVKYSTEIYFAVTCLITQGILIKWSGPLQL